MTEPTREEIIAAAKAAVAAKAEEAKRSNVPPVSLVYVIDNTVVDVLRTDERLAAIMLSEPTIVDFTDVEDLRTVNVTIGSTYDPETKTFTLPVEE
jgi:hypothetical protein